MREIIISLATVILVTCLILLFSCEAIKGTVANKNRNEVEIQVSEYRREKRELEKELSTLELSREKVITGIFRLMFFVNKADDTFTNEIYPLLKENNIVGTLCFDTDTISNLSAFSELYSSLISDGWQTALFYDGALSVSDWLSDFEKAKADNEFEIPSVVMLDEEDFNVEIAKELYSNGFVDIIVKRIKPDVDREDIEDGARITDSIGWCTFAASDLIKIYLPQTGDIVFTIGGDSVEEAYEPEQFGRMLTAINELVEKERLFFTTPSGTAAYKQKLRDEELLTKDEYLEKKEKLESRIETLELLIQEKYDEYIDGE